MAHTAQHSAAAAGRCCTAVGQDLKLNTWAGISAGWDAAHSHQHARWMTSCLSHCLSAAAGQGVRLQLQLQRSWYSELRWCFPHCHSAHHNAVLCCTASTCILLCCNAAVMLPALTHAVDIHFGLWLKMHRHMHRQHVQTTCTLT